MNNYEYIKKNTNFIINSIRIIEDYLVINAAAHRFELDYIIPWYYSKQLFALQKQFIYEYDLSVIIDVDETLSFYYKLIPMSEKCQLKNKIIGSSCSQIYEISLAEGLREAINYIK